MIRYIASDIIGRLKSKLKLSDTITSPEDVALLDIVLPMVDVGGLENRLKANRAAVSLVAAAGTPTAILTVPAGKRWRVKHIWREATLATSRVEIYYKDTLAWYELGLSGLTEQWLSTDLILDAGCLLGMDTTGNGGDTSILLTAHYQEEDILIS